MNYDFNKIEKKWQKFWAENQTFKTSNNSSKPKYYVLDMFPYPSGSGLHVGHPLGYIASDIYARYKRHKGFNVLHPQGYDSFGLPAEQYAIQTGQHPKNTTEINIDGCLDANGNILKKYINEDGSIKNEALIDKNIPVSIKDKNYQKNIIKGYRKQLDTIGFSFDWSREVRTSNFDFYKWTQWIFIQLYNSWYNKNTDKSEDINTLIAIFEKEGNKDVNAANNEHVELFSEIQWKLFSEDKKQEILANYRLTFLSETEVNWCPQLGTVLANDEIVNGVSERGGYPVVRKKMKQWSMRISAFAQRLLDGLNKVDWPQPLKDSQTNWIGRSEGSSIKFNVFSEDETTDYQIEVFTTRPDTIFGVSFMTLAPEHELVSKITTSACLDNINSYIEATAKRSERERIADVKNISGEFTGAYAIHPFTGNKIPIWIGDYVLAGYGTGAVMAVPCGDQRDYDFAKHFKLPIPNIFKDVDISEKAFEEKEGSIICNSDFLNNLPYKKAMKRIVYEIEQRGLGYGKVNYRLRDAVFSRQRYWGEPFPVYYKNGNPQLIDEKYLPILLPEVEKYLPTEDGNPPIGNATVWAWDTINNKIVNNNLINNKTIFPLELNTMPGWAGSSWYFNRYMDASNTEEFASQKALNYWKQVDLYIGGVEHATGHLLYSRFWQKFLFDKGLVPVDEFAKKLINQGMILGTSAFVYRVKGENKFVSKGNIDKYNVESIHADVSFVNSSNELDIKSFKNWRPEFKDAIFIGEKGDVIDKENDKYIVGREIEKMSKSKYNVVNPDNICEEYGADSLRLFEMFLGPLEQAKPWNTSGISGVHSFLKKLWKLYIVNDEFSVTEDEPTVEELKILHKTIKKVDEDIANFSFNTSVSSFMIAVNELTALKCNKRSILEPLIVLISPYAPHIAEEIWNRLGNAKSISTTSFPEFNPNYLVESVKKYPISFNGKMRFILELPLSLSKEELEKEVLQNERTIKQLDGKIPKKIIAVKGKIVNIVI